MALSRLPSLDTMCMIIALERIRLAKAAMLSYNLACLTVRSGKNLRYLVGKYILDILVVPDRRIEMEA